MGSGGTGQLQPSPRKAIPGAGGAGRPASTAQGPAISCHLLSRHLRPALLPGSGRQIATANPTAPAAYPPPHKSIPKPPVPQAATGTTTHCTAPPLQLSNRPEMAWGQALCGDRGLCRREGTWQGSGVRKGPVRMHVAPRAAKKPYLRLHAPTFFSHYNSLTCLHSFFSNKPGGFWQEPCYCPCPDPLGQNPGSCMGLAGHTRYMVMYLQSV